MLRLGFETKISSQNFVRRDWELDPGPTDTITRWCSQKVNKQAKRKLKWAIVPTINQYGL
jgi:hypothetical protein